MRTRVYWLARAGCYLSKVSYVRAGEPTLEQCYRPFHMVVYYRCVRFLPDGRVAMLTSPDEPAALVRALLALPHWALPSPAGGARASTSLPPLLDGLMFGTYCQTDDGLLVLELDRSNEKRYCNILVLDSRLVQVQIFRGISRFTSKYTKYFQISLFSGI